MKAQQLAFDKLCSIDYAPREYDNNNKIQSKPTAQKKKIQT